MSDLICPFCGEKDFDAIGLKSHLQRDCEAYANTENIVRLLAYGEDDE